MNLPHVPGPALHPNGSPTRVLLAAHPTVGHTNALLVVGRRLKTDGHDVAFAIPEAPRVPLAPEILHTAASIPRRIRAAGLRVVPLSPALSGIVSAVRLPFTAGYAELHTALTLFTAGAARTARQILDELARNPVDVIVADYTFLGAWLAAEVAHVPFAAFYHSGLPFPAPGGPPFGSGLTPDAPRDDRWEAASRALSAIRWELDQRIAVQRRTVGLPPVAPGLLLRPYGDLNLLATHPALELPRDDLGDRLVWVGPCTEDRPDPDEGLFPWTLLEGALPLAYVSMGTVFNQNPQVYEAILDGLEAAGLRCVVSAGASYERLSRQPRRPGVHLFPRVPQLAILHRVDLVVSHGGNNTVNETLAAGTPLLCVPTGAEQVENAHRVERLGAGRVVDLKSLNRDRIQAEATLLLQDRAFTLAAERISRSLRGLDGAGTAADAIVRFARSHAGTAPSAPPTEAP